VKAFLNRLQEVLYLLARLTPFFLGRVILGWRIMYLAIPHRWWAARCSGRARFGLVRFVVVVVAIICGLGRWWILERWGNLKMRLQVEANDRIRCRWYSGRMRLIMVMTYKFCLMRLGRRATVADGLLVLLLVVSL
jgi:hypothetical protein